MADQIKPRIIAGVGWCDAGCPQSSDFQDGLVFCGALGRAMWVSSDYGSAEVCPVHASRVAAERDKLRDILIRILASTPHSMCADAMAWADAEAVLAAYQPEADEGVKT